MTILPTLDHHTCTTSIRLAFRDDIVDPFMIHHTLPYLFRCWLAVTYVGLVSLVLSSEGTIDRRLDKGRIVSLCVDSLI
jgi:hypothetical protein